jgi:hypothetical protein
LESVKHVNRIRECGDIDYPEGAGTLANPDLANPDLAKTLGPIDGIGRQSSGSGPRCTRSN